MSAGKKGQIDSDRVVVRELFSNFWFRIPEYQRAYVWGKDEISELIDDVNYASARSTQGQYFLGSMVLRKVASGDSAGVSFEEHEVLDGQQRLTTLMLMLACIRDRVSDGDLKDTCREMLYQKENRWKKIPGRQRLLYSIRGDVEEFLKDQVAADDGTRNTSLASFLGHKNLSLANMAAGLQIIHACFEDRERFASDADVDRFISYLLNNALFIYVATDDLDDAFRLFTILNDRGIPLSNSDILKARNLGAVSRDANRAKWAKYWEEAEGEMGRDDFDRFLSYVRTLCVKDKAREGLLKEFDDRIYGAKPPVLTEGEVTFKAIEAYKKAYDLTIKLDELPPALGNAYRNRIGVMDRGLPSTDWVPPVLAWYQKFGTVRLLDLIERIDNKFSAEWIVQLTPTQRINNMNEVLKAIDAASTVDQALASKDFNFSREGLAEAFSGEIYGRRFAKYVLLRLEYALASHAAPLNLPDEISVEHVLPQNPGSSSQWASDFSSDQREEWTHRLGNLMLLSQRKNASLGNLDFADKRKRYLEARVESLPNSQRLLGLSAFLVTDLQARHDDLLRTLLATY